MTKCFVTDSLGIMVVLSINLPSDCRDVLGFDEAS
jgi:hypothetical protein